MSVLFSPWFRVAVHGVYMSFGGVPFCNCDLTSDFNKLNLLLSVVQCPQDMCVSTVCISVGISMHEQTCCFTQTSGQKFNSCYAHPYCAAPHCCWMSANLTALLCCGARLQYCSRTNVRWKLRIISVFEVSFHVCKSPPSLRLAWRLLIRGYTLADVYLQ